MPAQPMSLGSDEIRSCTSRGWESVSRQTPPADLMIPQSQGSLHRSNAEVAELHPAAVLFGAVGLQRENAGAGVAVRRRGVGVVHDFGAIERHLDVAAARKDAELIPGELAPNG